TASPATACAVVPGATPEPVTSMPVPTPVSVANVRLFPDAAAAVIGPATAPSGASGSAEPGAIPRAAMRRAAWAALTVTAGRAKHGFGFVKGPASVDVLLSV